jgi:hypothetical protein
MSVRASVRSSVQPSVRTTAIGGGGSPAFSPSDVSQVIADFNPAVNGFSDVAGTIVATENGTLRSVRSSVGSLIAIANGNRHLKRRAGGLAAVQSTGRWDVAGINVNRRDFVIWLVNEESAHYTLVGLAGFGTNQFIFHGEANRITVFNGSQSNSLPVIPLDWKSLKLVSGASSTRFSFDGTQVSSATSAFGSGTAADIQIFGQTDYPISGAWKRCIVASPAPSAEDIANIDAYLAEQYPSTAVPLDKTAIIVDGNSFIAGSATGEGEDITTQLILELGSNYEGRNRGKAGNSTTNLIPKAPIDVDPFYNASRVRNVLVFWEITNDITGGADAASALSAYRSYRASREAVFGQENVIICDCLLRSSWDATLRGYRASVNASLAAEYTTPTAAPYIWEKSGGGLLYKASEYFTDAAIGTWSDDNLHPNAAANIVIAQHLSGAILL